MSSRTAKEDSLNSPSKIKSPSDSNHSSTDVAYPRRNLDHLYCSAITYLCARGTLPPAGGGQREKRATAKPCVPCAYKICNFDIALDSEFNKRVPNQRPEQCPRSSSGSSRGEKLSNNSYDEQLDGTMGYRRGMNVLTVGDGDFTYSLALAHLVVRDGAAEPSNNIHRPGMVVATSYEDSPTLRKVYPDFDKTLDSLNSYGERNIVLGYNVDATRLNETLPKGLQDSETIKFDRICWNFPCTAINGGQDGQNSAMEQNKELVRKFVANALPYLDEECGEIHMAHKTKPPYNQWGLEKVALEGIERSENGCRKQFEFKGRIAFDKCTYKGYTPRKALDRKSFPCHDACIYVFGWKFERNVEGRSSSPKLQSLRDRHTTIPENQVKASSDKLPKPPAIIPVTERVIENIRSIHLKNAGRKAKERHNKKHFRPNKRNDETRKKRRKD